MTPRPGADASAARIRRIYLDQTHLRGHVTGIERVTLDLFAPGALAPHAVRTVASGSLPGMIAAQHLALPLHALRDPDALFLFPGFPPSPLCAFAASRCLLYVHDTFLLTRPEDLSLRSRLYMSPSFALALRWCPNLFVNSRTTGAAVRAVCASRARVALLRPPVRDAFGLGGLSGPAPFAPGDTLRLLAIGTIEPRKNYPAALALTAALIRIGIPAELHLVGRVGWGRHEFLDAPPPFLHRHGYLSDAELRGLAASCHLLLSTSKAEGLGLPLLEVQHGGLPVVAPDEPVFREVLGRSGLLIRPEEPGAAARRVAAWLSADGLAHAAAASRDNVARWNAAAAEDGVRFRRFLAGDQTAYDAGNTIVSVPGSA